MKCPKCKNVDLKPTKLEDGLLVERSRYATEKQKPKHQQ